MTHRKLLCCQKVELHVPPESPGPPVLRQHLHIPGHSSRTVSDLRHQGNAALKRRKMTSNIDNFNSVSVEKTETRKSNMTTTGIYSLHSRAEKETSKTPENELSVILKVGREFVGLCAISKVHDIMHGNSLRNRSSYDHDVNLCLKRRHKKNGFLQRCFRCFQFGHNTYSCDVLH